MITSESTLLDGILADGSLLPASDNDEATEVSGGPAVESADPDLPVLDLAWDNSSPFDYSLNLSDGTETATDEESAGPYQVVCIRPFFPPPDSEGDAPLFSILPYYDGEFEDIVMMPPEGGLGEEEWIEEDWTEEGWTDEEWIEEDWTDEGWIEEDGTETSDPGTGEDELPVDVSGDGSSSGEDAIIEDDGFIWIDWSS